MPPTATLSLSTPSDREIRMERVFAAPRALVFEALTKPELVRRWLTGPPGWVMETCEIDLRVGGAYRYVWSGPGGARMGMGGVCRELAPPDRIVNTEKFDDYPGVAVGTVILTEAGGRTTVTTTILYESREIRDAVLKTPMESGVAASYEKLDALLGESRR